MRYVAEAVIEPSYLRGPFVVFMVVPLGVALGFIVFWRRSARRASTK